MIYQPEIERMPLDQLRKLQNERLRTLISYVYARVPFYRRVFDENGLLPADIRGIEDLYKIPFTRKKHLRDHYPFGMFAVPMAEVARLHASSGTTGKPTVVGFTKQDLETFSEVVARSLAASGCRPGMILQNAYGYGLFTGGLGLHYGAEKLGMTVVPVSGGMTERQLLLLQDFQPDAISCTPSYAQTLSEEIVRRGIPLSALNLRYAILGAEPWTDTVRAEVEKSLGVTATNIYGLSEIMGPGVSNEDYEEKGTGSYIWEDHFFPEIVDRETGEPLPEGKYGVLVFTTLTKQAMPLLRYWTNDITTLHHDRGGKRTHVKMGQILGRADDMLIIRGVNLFHTQVEEILQDFVQLNAHYQLVVTRPRAMDEVEVVAEVNDKVQHGLGVTKITTETVEQHEVLNQLQKAIAHRIKDNIGITMKVTLVENKAIPRSDGGKLSRIRDLRKP